MLSSRGWDTCCSINKRAATVSDSIWYRNLWRTRETVQTQVLSSLYLFASTRSNCGHKLQTSVGSETGGGRGKGVRRHLSGFDILINTARPTGHASLGTPSSHAAATPASQRVCHNTDYLWAETKWSLMIMTQMLANERAFTQRVLIRSFIVVWNILMDHIFTLHLHVHISLQQHSTHVITL